MKRTEVKSSSLASVGYDPAHECLEVEFRSGTVYQLTGVRASDWNDFNAAESKGRFFNEFLRNKFPGRRIDPPTQHGKDCHKVAHENADVDYHHEEGDDSPFELQGVVLCGRCHMMMTQALDGK